MAEKYIKKICLYIFLSVEIFALALLLLLIEYFPGFIRDLQMALNLYKGAVFGIIVLEIVYFVGAIKKKMGYIGLPLQMITAFKRDIFENLFSITAVVTYRLAIVIGIIMLLRITAIVYLYKNQDSAKGFPGGTLMTATLIDLAYFIKIFFI